MRRPPVGRPAYDPLDPLDPLMCGHGCELDGAVVDPVDEDDDTDCDDAVDGEDDTELVAVLPVDVVAEPPVEASATPVAPAPSPPAITAVMISRRTRALVLDTIRFLLPPRALSGSSDNEQPARPASPRTEHWLCVPSEPGFAISGGR
jgi:hypothetical protein